MQAAVEAAVPAGCGFDFDGDVAVCGFGEDVYLGAVVVAPEVEWVSEAGVGQVGADFVQDECFQQAAAFLVADWVRQAAGEGAGNAAVKEVKLAVADLLVGGLQLPGWQPKADQGVDKQVEMVLHGGSGHSGVPGDGGHIRGLAVLPRGHFKKAGEAGKVARQRFGADFLIEIGFGVASQILLGRWRCCGDWQAAEAECFGNIEIAAEFGGHQRKHLRGDGAAGEQVHAAPAQFSRA